MAMKLKDLKSTIRRALKGKPREETTAPKIAWAPRKHFKASKFRPSNFTLPFICEDKVFPLLELPLELVKIIISELVANELPHRTLNLRTVNSK
jgi:hypothetical protein